MASLSRLMDSEGGTRSRSKLCRPCSVVTDDPSAWNASTITKIIKRCPARKARESRRGSLGHGGV
eukprot:553528-Amphidinium_carterae.1